MMDAKAEEHALVNLNTIESMAKKVSIDACGMQVFVTRTHKEPEFLAGIDIIVLWDGLRDYLAGLESTNYQPLYRRIQEAKSAQQVKLSNPQNPN